MTRKGAGAAAVSSIVLIILWSAAALAINAPFILPGPAAVFTDLLSLLGTTVFRSELLATLFRGLAAFTVSFVLSLILGCISGISDLGAAALKPWMSVVKSTPVVSIILIALLWFGSSFVPVFVSVLMTLPVMTEALARGIRETDRKLMEMAKIYRFRKRDILLRIQLGSAFPFLLAGSGSALGLTWKVVVAGEILGLPRTGLGTAIQTARVQLESLRVFSLTIMAIGLSVASEYLFSRLSAHFMRNKTARDEKQNSNEVKIVS